MKGLREDAPLPGGEAGDTPSARAASAFRGRFGREPAVTARAPGRVNLIGEHTDYTGGFVLPAAINREVALAGSARPDRTVRVHSLDYDEEVAFDLGEARLDDVRRDAEHPWSNYLRGVFAVLQAAGLPVTGADVTLCGDVPQGAGLSSSAAIEVAAVAFAQAASGFDLDPLDAVKLARQAENEFVGVQCGIMDQFVSRLGRRGHALFIDTGSLRYEQVPIPAGEARIVVTDTRVRRRLVGSDYNRRRDECEQALAIARRRLGRVRLPRELTPAELAELEPAMSPVLSRRLRHLAEENHRVEQAVTKLRQGDLAGFGRLMDGSHDSLRDLFEVSCPELDAAVEIARSVPGVLGARMTGAGFGGCTVTLVRPEAVGALVAAIEAEYPKRTGIDPHVFVLETSDGAVAHRS